MRRYKFRMTLLASMPVLFLSIAAIADGWDTEATVTTSTDVTLDLTPSEGNHANTEYASRAGECRASDRGLSVKVSAVANAKQMLGRKNFKAEACCTGASIKAKCRYTGSGPAPAAQFNLQTYRVFDWHNRGNADNGQWGRGLAKAAADGQITLVYTNGDSQSDDIDSSAHKTENEADSWYLWLSLQWQGRQIIPALGWEDFATGSNDTWLNTGFELDAYNQTVTNVMGDVKFDAVYAKSTLLGTATARTENKAKNAESAVAVTISDFSMTRVVIPSNAAAKAQAASLRQDDVQGRPVPNDSIVDAWEEAARQHEIPREQVRFVRSLLRELSADAIVLDNRTEKRLRQSLDTYLKQFAPWFKGEAETAEMYGYYLAWLICQGAEHAATTGQGQEEARRVAYDTFVDEIVFDINTRLLRKNGVDIYAEYIDTIRAGSQGLRDRLMSYYDHLHDDFLYPALKLPVSDAMREDAISHVRRACAVPCAFDPRGGTAVDDEFFKRKLAGYFRGIAKIPLYRLTLKTIWRDFHYTEAWGYMHAQARTCSPHMGKWPIDVRFRPDRDFNRAIAEEGPLKGL